MSIRRVLLDVDKAVSRPDITELAEAVERLDGVEGVNITVNEIDIETVGMNITIEGEGLDYRAIVETIEAAGAVVHSVDEVSAGKRLIEPVRRAR